MPQLEIGTFASQLFWLTVTFSLLYFVLSGSILPKISSVLQGRQDRITNDLEAAEKLKKEAEEMEAGYIESMNDTRARAAKIIAEAAEKVQEKADERNAELTEVLFKQLEESADKLDEARIRAFYEMAGLSAELSKLIVHKVSGIDVSEGDAESAVSDAVKAA